MTGAIAIIPARGGSVGVPGKNLARVGGVPLIARAVRAALHSGEVDAVVVTTDDPRIAKAARGAGAVIVERPTDLATGEATSESAILHALSALPARLADASVVVFLQATSPFIDSAAVADAVRRVREGVEDVVFSAAPSHVFVWREGESGAYGVNHDASGRLRRQDREPEFAETGAFYVMDRRGFERAGHRFFGRVGVALVSPGQALEIDEPHDLDIARAIAPLHDLGERVDVDAIAWDFDGVHTDDHLTLQQDGTESVRLSRSDGMGISLLRRAGIPMIIVSTESNAVVAARGAKLGLETHHGVDDKVNVVQQWSERLGTPLDRVAYVGNDVNDLDCLARVGWPVAVADAHPFVIAAARTVLTRRGGKGAVRELAELVLNGRKAAHVEQRDDR